MKKVSVGDLRHKFARVEELLRSGEEILITKRKRIVARLLPPDTRKQVQWPDVMARLKSTYGDRVLEPSGAELLAQDRERF